jgi:hypothetical protein
MAPYRSDSPRVVQRIVFTQYTDSYLLFGDPDRDDDRYWMTLNGRRTGCALPVLLREGWKVKSITALMPAMTGLGGKEKNGQTFVLLEHTLDGSDE